MLFQEKDVICFLGDSMTAGGYWMAEAYQEIRKKVKVKCYNCGVSGGTAYRAEGYLYSRCLAYNPDWVVVMFGINDIDIIPYDPEYTLPDKQARIDTAMERYKRSYENLITKIQEFGAKVIVGIPIPYDEVSSNETPNVMCQRGLDIATAYAMELAERYHCPVVNFDKVFRPLYPNADVIRADRVHPTEYGYHMMAQIFLKETGVIDTCDFESEFVFEEWNKKRFEAEQALHYTNFVQYCAFYDPQNPFADRQEIARKVREALEKQEDKESFFAKAYREYLEKAPYRDVYQSEIVKCTI